MAPRALPGNLGCPPWTPRRTEGQQPQSSAQAGIAQVRRDASRLHHSVGIQRGYLCRRGCIVAPLHSQGYSTVTSARPHTVFYAVPFFTFKQDGDASRLPPLTWGYIVAASVCFKARISYKIAPCQRMRSVPELHHKEPWPPAHGGSGSCNPVYSSTLLQTRSGSLS